MSRKSTRNCWTYDKCGLAYEVAHSFTLTQNNNNSIDAGKMRQTLVCCCCYFRCCRCRHCWRRRRWAVNLNAMENIFVITKTVICTQFGNALAKISRKLFSIRFFLICLQTLCTLRCLFISFCFAWINLTANQLVIELYFVWSDCAPSHICKSRMKNKQLNKIWPSNFKKIEYTTQKMKFVSIALFVCKNFREINKRDQRKISWIEFSAHVCNAHCASNLAQLFLSNWFLYNRISSISNASQK